MNKQVKVLMVEDSEDDAKLALRALRHGGFNPTHRRVQTGTDLKAALAEERWDAVISDFQMPGFSGMDALRIFRSTGLDIPFILVSGTIGEETAVNAMKGGASDYVMKNGLARLAPALERELKETQSRADHRLVQQALTDSEKNFRQLAENIRDVFFLIDAHSNRMLYISPAYEEIWGRTCESLYSNPESWTEAFHPDDRASTYKKYKKGMSAGRFEYESRIVRPDGSIRWMGMRGFPVRDGAGKIVRIAGVAEDITERKTASHELRESERRFSDMLGNVQMVSVMVDRDARISYCNDYLLQLTGYRREEVIGRDWFERFISEPSVPKANFAALLANRPEARHRESEILTRSGERRVIRWNNSLLLSGAGDVIGTASIGEDITDQKKNQESLRQNEERTRLIVESALDAVVVMDATGRITDWNTQAEKTFGWSREQVVGIQLTETIVPPKYREAHKRGLRAFLETGEGALINKRIEIPAMHRDGHEIPVELTISPIRLGGAWIFSSFIRDLTERKRADEALAQLRRQSELILESIGEGIHGIDMEGRIIFENSAAAKLLGYSIEDLSGRPAHATMHHSRKDGTPYPIADCPIYTAMHDGTIRRVEDEVFWRKDGSSFPVEYTTAPIRNDRNDITGAVVAFRDITDRKEAETRIRRLNRVYAMLSDIHSLISRVRDRGELFSEACRIAVQSGQFPLAWVAVAHPLDQLVKAVAWAGDEGGFVQLTRPTVGVKGDGNAGLSAQAIEKRIPVVCNDIEADGSAMRYAKEALARGYRSAAALPLVVDGAAIGTLVLYAAEAGFFDDEEMKLLVELASDISFALDNIEKEKKVRRLTRVHAVLTDINAAIVRIRDREELFRESCRIAVDAGQLQLAWIGVVDAQNEVIVPAASSGPEKGLLEVIRLSTREDNDQLGMAGRAIRNRVPGVSNDVLADKRARFGAESVHRGLRSLAMIPLMADGVAIGVLGLHAAEAGFFDQDEMKLLMEVAGNIAFALEHIAKEEKVRRLTRVHAMLSGINTLIVRVRDRGELFREACRIAVEHGRFKMAWIGVVDRSAMKIVPIASAGAEPEFLTLIEDSFSLREDAPLGNTMSARVVNEKKAIVVNEIRDDARILFPKERIERGIHSMAILPLLVSGDAVGMLALYSDETGFFDDEEMKLLTELADNSAFAIDHIDKQERLDYLAYYDALTGLANRSLFLERVAQYTRSAATGGHKLALFLIDLERFKNINDTLGRPVGDALLRQVAEWLTRNVGDANLLARVGADHFAMVVPEVKQEADVARLLEKTMAAFLEHPFRLNDTVFRIAAKVGVVLFPDDGADADTLFKNAEAALKKAKASGDRYVFYTQKMTAAVAGKLTLENQLRQALDNDEFVLHYQPKVNLQSGKLTGAEALIRWNDPRTGLVPPMRFIPILEETGLIHEVGRWALRKAIEEYLRWRSAGLAAVRIAVNVSPLQLRHRGFIAEIGQAIGIDARAAAGLELEITENMIMEDVKESIASLQAIRAMGLSIAIDDFGTGFSSLGYLSKLPVDTLKIDRSFVIDMTASPQGLALVSTIITLAHSLKLKVVAEGVETEEQARLLRLLNCNEMQGYLFSKPVPSEIFETKFLGAPSVLVASSGRLHELSSL